MALNTACSLLRIIIYNPIYVYGIIQDIKGNEDASYLHIHGGWGNPMPEDGFREIYLTLTCIISQVLTFDFT